MSDVDLGGLSVRQLRARRRRLVGSVQGLEATLRGALLREGRRCSSRGCRCQRGELHGPYRYLAFYRGGRSRLVYVPAVLAAVVEAQLRSSECNEAALAEISLINVELLRRRALE